LSRPERPTVPTNPGDHAFEGASSDIRPLVPLSGVPSLLVTDDGLRGLPLDPRAGFVISRIDGKSDVETLLDVCALPENETLAIVAELVRLGVIAFLDLE
jgi:hypothetical protein